MDYYKYLILISVFVVLDIVSGIIKAIENENLSSQKMREGLFHKITFYIAFSVSVAIEIGSNIIDLGYNVPLAAGVTLYICLTEIVSIIENICEINPELKDSDITRILKPKD